MIIDGRAIANELLASVRSRVQELDYTPLVRVVAVAPSPVTESYLRAKTTAATKAGMQLEVVRVEDPAREEDIKAAITQSGADSIIVQLPLPANMNVPSILSEIPIELDADILSSAAYERFLRAEPGALLPPVTEAVRVIVTQANVQVAGKKAVVIGGGRLVGHPVAAWLQQQGAQVSVITLESGDWSLLRDADIVVSGAGSPGLITPDQLKSGVVLMDAGTAEQNGVLKGDADPACAEVASIFTPVPGGMGPLSVACLYTNVYQLIVQQREGK